MAAADDLFTCAICKDRLKSPRRLPCHHVYCLECLRGLVKEETDHVTCPECRRDHVVPNNRVDWFPVERRLQELHVRGEMTRPAGPASDEHWIDFPAFSKCEHSQPACLACRTNRALLLELLLQESRQFRADFFTENQIITRQKQKAQLHGHQENLSKLRTKIVSEIEYIIKEFEKRRLTLLARIDEEEKFILGDLSKLDQADAICAEYESLPASLVSKVPPSETLVSLRTKLSKQKDRMTSLQYVGQNTRVLDVQFNRDQLRKMIDSYGDFFRVVDCRNNFTLATTSDGSESGSMFKQPWGLTVCPFTDNVYVTDYTSVRVYNNNGEYIRHVVTNDLPTGVTIDSNQRVIVTSCKENNIKIYNHELKFIRAFGTKGIKNGEFRGPMSVTCDRNDNIHVVDRCNMRIQVFTPNGILIAVMGRHMLQNPCCVLINIRDEILFTDYKLGQIVFFKKDGTLIKTMTGEGGNKLNGPYGICLDDRNRIFVADQSSKKIQVYNDDGTHHSTITQPAAAMKSMCGLAVTRSGVIFITDYDGNKIHRIVSTLS